MTPWDHFFLSTKNIWRTHRTYSIVGLAALVAVVVIPLTVVGVVNSAASEGNRDASSGSLSLIPVARELVT